MDTDNPCAVPLVAIIGATLMVLAQIDYALAIFKNVRPRVLSWFGWSIFMGTSAAAQYVPGACAMELLTLTLSAIGCSVIGLLALLAGRFAYSRGDWWYLAAGSLCIGVYYLFDDPWTTTAIALLADVILALPTLINAWKNPGSERSRAWWWGACAWGVTLVSLMNKFDWLIFVWPIYCFLFNLAMIWMAYWRRPVKG